MLVGSGAVQRACNYILITVLLERRAIQGWRRRVENEGSNVLKAGK